LKEDRRILSAAKM